MHITLGFSTCPNDTFMFDAMVHGRIDTGGITFDIIMEDIFHLNQRAMKGELDMVKISYNTFGHVLHQYDLLTGGSALGHKCGPLLIAKEALDIETILNNPLPVAIPGEHTTANLLLGFYAPMITRKKSILFHEIMPAVVRRDVSAGVIIHENRFTYQDHGLHLIQDLGTYWETQTHMPIPLGGIVAKKSLGKEVIEQLNQIMKNSVAHAFAHPGDSKKFVEHHAQEMNPTVMQSHIDLYVNHYSLDLGSTGIEAVKTLLNVGEEMGLYPLGNQAHINWVH